jgi:glycosyltransferase involved in cell wall biosynthesis
MGGKLNQTGFVPPSKARQMADNLPEVPLLQADFAACTIIAKNYLSMARVLADSFHRHQPDCPFFVLFLDSTNGYFDPAKENIYSVGLSQLDIPNLPGFLFKYNVLEASTAVKPFLLSHLLKKHDIQKLVYFDPDILITGGLNSLSDILGQHSIVLTPHITTPYADRAQPGELEILQAGSYNLGFIGLQKGPVATRLLSWWEQKVYHHCRIAVEQGIFVDQKWIDLVPGFFEEVKILRDPGYNVAYWNLHERRIEVHNDNVSVNGQPLYFFHFSGFNPGNKSALSKHQNRFNWKGLGDVRILFEKYSDLVLAKGWQETKDWPYDYNYFTNGVRIPDEARRYYWSLGEETEYLGNPFEWLEKSQPAAALTISGKTGVALRRILAPVTNLPFGVNLAGYASSEKGVGEALRAHLRSLNAADVPCVVNEFVDTGSENVESGFHTSDQNPYGVNLIMVNADQVPHFAQNKDGYFQGRYNIGGWNWELSTFPREWCASFDFFHEIWAPSGFVAQSLAPHSPMPIVTMPYSLNLDLEIGAEWTRPRFDLPVDAFMFLFFFDFHSLMERKNPLGLIRAFEKAFGNRKDVLLVIKCSHLHFPEKLDPQFAAQVKNSYQQLVQASTNTNVKLLDAVLPRQGVIGIMSLSDCYVSLHRSEGYGLTMAEAMSLGKPVIATSYSGNMDFMKADNSFLVKHRLIEIQRDWGPYKKGKIWADPDLDHAAELMRHVYEHRESAALVAEKGRQDVVSKLHPKVVGEMIRNHLQRVFAKSPGNSR